MRLHRAKCKRLKLRNDSETMLKNRSSTELNRRRSCLRGRLIGLLLMLMAAFSPAARAQFFPFNDAFTNALFLAGPSGTTSGFNFGATSETNEPVHAAQGG